MARKTQVVNVTEQWILGESFSWQVFYAFRKEKKEKIVKDLEKNLDWGRAYLKIRLCDGAQGIL